MSRGAQDARRTWVGANVAMVDVAQDARRTVGYPMSVSRKMRDVRWGGIAGVAQNARRTVVGCSMSRWLMSRKMRDVRGVLNFCLEIVKRLFSRKHIVYCNKVFQIEVSFR